MFIPNLAVFLDYFAICRFTWRYSIMASTPIYFHQHALVVPARHVKAVKTFLEERRILDKSKKITPYFQTKVEQGDPAKDQIPEPGKRFVIPFLQDAQETGADGQTEHGSTLEAHLRQHATPLESLLGSDAYKSISITRLEHHDGTPTPTQQTNPLRAAFHAALSALPPETLSHLSLTPAQLAADLPSTYTIYPPLLLLPAHAFRQPTWTTLLAHHPPTSHITRALLAAAAAALGVTHIAANAPIAPTTTTTTTTGEGDNTLRSPTALTPLHGAFGPPGPNATPTRADFARAFWATARQNGVAQTWAPRHTMFSRGNVKEKARLLGLAAVREASGCAAVDLYAGIGYFAFSYRKAGVARVLGWEINAWSVEGLRRGAGANGWGVGVVGGGEEEVDEGFFERDFVVFLESNEHAAGRVEGLRERVPPVRHVNAGLLPTSRGGWETAVRVLDPGLGGWVHLHENFGEGEINARAEEVVREVRKIWKTVRVERCGRSEIPLDAEDTIKLEHVERVKTYAPGVLHCVLDIWISPTGRAD